MSIVLGISCLIPLCLVYFSVFEWIYYANHILFAILLVPFFGFYVRDVVLKVKPPYKMLDNFEQGSLKQHISRSVLKICQSVNIKPPSIYLKEDENVNVFAYGLNQHFWSLVITTGLIDFYDHKWLRIECAIAHEIGHSTNRDLFFPTITDFPAFLLGRIGSLVFFIPNFIKRLFKPALVGGAASMFLFRGGCMTIFLLIMGIMFLILLFYIWFWALLFAIYIVVSVFVGLLPVMAFNRWREKKADVFAVEQTGDPEIFILTLGKGFKTDPTEEYVARETLTRCGRVYDQGHMIAFLDLAKERKISTSFRMSLKALKKNHPFIAVRIQNLVNAFPNAFGN